MREPHRGPRTDWAGVGIDVRGIGATSGWSDMDAVNLGAVPDHKQVASRQKRACSAHQHSINAPSIDLCVDRGSTRAFV